MNSLLDISLNLGANGLPYALPIHPKLVHLTLGLFIIAVIFDIAGNLFPLERPLFKVFAVTASRSGFYDVGWYNLLAAAIATVFTVAAGFFEVMLADKSATQLSAWGLSISATMLLHGLSGILLWGAIVAMTVWRGFQRYRWRKELPRQVHLLGEPANAQTKPTVQNPNQQSASEEVEVIAKQWSWSFRYPDSNVTSTELHLPVNQSVRLKLRSLDVLHGFYVPEFRVKQDIIPNRAITFTFTPLVEGKYRLCDSQFSGTYFALMAADVIVESPAAYNQWLALAATQTPTAAKNSAFAEHAKRSQNENGGWITVPPAAPPVVNYSS